MASPAVDSPQTPLPPAAKSRRRWYQFTLRAAGVWMVLLCLLLGSFAWWRDRAERQRKVVEELRALGAVVEYRYFSLIKRHVSGNPVLPEDEFFLNYWACHWFGDDFVRPVDSVNLAVFGGDATLPPETIGLALRLLQKCPNLKELTLDGNVVNSTHLKQIPFLETLEGLGLAAESSDNPGMLTDNDLALLERAVCLEYLSLENQPIGDASMLHIRHCRRLRVLLLRNTSVTDAGLDQLQDLPDPICVSLRNTRVTPTGLRRFKDRYPNCLVD